MALEQETKVEEPKNNGKHRLLLSYKKHSHRWVWFVVIICLAAFGAYKFWPKPANVSTDASQTSNKHGVKVGTCPQ